MHTIGIDYTPAYEQGGGIGRYVRDLVTALTDTASQEAKYKLFVSGVTDQKPLFLSQNASWHTTRLSPKWLARLWHRARLPLVMETFTGEIDLFHATDFVMPPLRRKTRSLLTVHDLSYLLLPETASPGLRRYLMQVVPRSIKCADHILADSQSTKNDLIAHYNVNVDKITVLYSGVDARFVPIKKDGQNTDTLIKKYKLPHNPFILSVGTVQPRKNYARIVQALAILRQQHDVDLVIAGGKGWLEDEMYRVIDQTHMNDHVHLIGFVDDQHLPWLYNQASIFAFPSLYEGFGLPVLESMACGTPVITSNVSSLPEVAGNAAIMINPYDVEALAYNMSKILSDTQARKQMIVRGFEQIEKFSWNNSAQQLQEIYLNML
jgi:glycosyltransferase involved in cell wall biosynthesis